MGEGPAPRPPRRRDRPTYQSKCMRLSRFRFGNNPHACTPSKSVTAKCIRDQNRTAHMRDTSRPSMIVATILSFGRNVKGARAGQAGSAHCFLDALRTQPAILARLLRPREGMASRLPIRRKIWPAKPPGRGMFSEACLRLVFASLALHANL